MALTRLERVALILGCWGKLGLDGHAGTSKGIIFGPSSTIGLLHVFVARCR